ncbi:hypothetical protein SAMN05660657_05069 [Geodermatophilus amargosae]|uniref:Uncharacterized protein n=1 Tax=Geodermatophilus amargosae TaxID=1296565 RepID=A0A1I7CZ60_9ACTN|nr:hypothetical protein [Geodermatophilus amargosae]SFU04718.1 hypothetical protein SAMN05660657_05069 [Geodermatophilus amargosae]
MTRRRSLDPDEPVTGSVPLPFPEPDVFDLDAVVAELAALGIDLIQLDPEDPDA